MVAYRTRLGVTAAGHVTFTLGEPRGGGPAASGGRGGLTAARLAHQGAVHRH